MNFSFPRGAVALLLSLFILPAGAADRLMLRVLAFNDFHGHVAPHGAAALEQQLARLRSGIPHHVTVSAGDMIGASPLESSLFRDEPTIEAMNLLGLDIAVVGNHEFDRGFAELQRLMRGGCATDGISERSQTCRGPGGRFDGARFSMLGANVTGADGRPLLPPVEVRRYAGIPVDFIGVVTRSTPSLVPPAGVQGLRFTDEVAAVNRAVRALRRDGVHAFVVIMHEGGFVDRDDAELSCPSARGRAFAMADRFDPDVKLVLTGHTHQAYRCLRNGRLILQAGSYARLLSRIDLALDPASGRIDLERSTADNLPLPAADLPAATPVAARVAHYSELARPLADKVVGRIAAGFDRKPLAGANSTLGALVADTQLAATRAAADGGAQIAFMNAGGLRADWPCSAGPCELRFRDLASAQPFSNALVTIILTGTQLQALLEQQVRADRIALLQPSAGFRYRLDARAAPGRRVTGMTLDGEPVHAQRAYRVTVNAFLAEGGDGFTVLGQGRARRTGMLDLEATLRYLQSQVPVPDRLPRVELVADPAP